MPPIYISYIFHDYIRLVGDTSKIQDVISKSKYRDKIFHDEHGLNIRFIPYTPIFDNKSLLELLQWLNSFEIPFSVDKGWGPSEIMQELQKRGLLKDSFFEISWSDPSNWTTTKRNPAKK